MDCEGLGWERKWGRKFLPSYKNQDSELSVASPPPSEAHISPVFQPDTLPSSP